MSTYGAGTATQFSDGTQRQVLELGPKIYYYNESVTPLLSISGRAGAVQTPVPIYEWMEDEYFIKRSVKTPIVSTDVADTATGGINGHHTVVKFRKDLSKFLNRNYLKHDYRLNKKCLKNIT